MATKPSTSFPVFFSDFFHFFPGISQPRLDFPPLRQRLDPMPRCAVPLRRRALLISPSLVPEIALGEEVIRHHLAGTKNH